jgi:hypothetical protein
LPVGDFDGLEETGFGALSVSLRALERDLTIDTVQIGEPEPLAGSLDECEGVLKGDFGALHLAPHQQGFGKVGFENGIGKIPAGSIVGG